VIKTLKVTEINQKSVQASITAENGLTDFTISETGHPNQKSFAGILTFFDVPSDYAPNGAGGLRVLIPSSVGIPALDSLKGMAVNFIDTMDGHAPTEKIGVITQAQAGEPQDDGAIPVYIQGYVYAFDFPEETQVIVNHQSLLGFSYETAQTLLSEGEYNGQPVAVVQSLGYFTGASILLKQAASYQATQLVAAKEEVKQVDEATKALLDELKQAISGLQEYVDTKFQTLENVQSNEDEAKEEQTEEVSAENEEGKTEEPAAEETKDAEEDSKEDSKDESAEDESKEESKEDTEVKASKEETTELNAGESILAARIQEKLDAALAELASLKAENVEKEKHQRKSVAYPVTLMAKYDIQPQDDYKSLLASIDAREDLSVEQRMALKFEARQKNNKK
jgi:hypothetical protein